jgi:hypothetical protein
MHKTKFLIFVLCSITLINTVKTQINAPAPVTEWQKTFGGSGRDLITSIINTKDGGYIFIGTSGSRNGDLTGIPEHLGIFLFDYWVVKLSEKGEIQWQKQIGGSGDEQPASIIQDSDGGYVIL